MLPADSQRKLDGAGVYRRRSYPQGLLVDSDSTLEMASVDGARSLRESSGGTLRDCVDRVGGMLLGIAGVMVRWACGAVTMDADLGPVCLG